MFPPGTTDADRLSLVKEYAGKSGWQVRRFCQEDWLLHVRVCSDKDQVRRTQRYEVALFLAEDHWKFTKDSAVIGGLILALSDAYHQLGRMELHFVGHEPTIPAAIRRVAADRFAVTFRNQSEISDDEGRNLYERITGLTDQTLQLLDDRGISRQRACFIVQRGIWSRDQVEFLASQVRFPERLFQGGAPDEFRISRVSDLVYLRIAVMGERARTVLELNSDDETEILNVEWVDGATVRIRPTSAVRVDALGSSSIEATRQKPLVALLAPRSAADYARYAAADMPSRTASNGEVIGMFVTQDIYRMSVENIDKLLAIAAARNVAIIPVVDSLAELDAEIERRLDRAASTNREMPERPD